MSGGGEQLVSFFLYSLFIYPVTNYIVSPQRKYPRWRSAAYAIIFLIVVAALHMMYDNMENGPNHYQLLRVTRDTPIAAIKKSYRNLSLEFHPDKNKDPSAADTFTKIKHAFDVITDKDKRREYNRLGEHGVAVLAQTVVDYRYIVLQLIVYYASSGIFAFLMTFSEPTGDAFQICLFGLAVMLLIEMLLVVQEVQLPSWFLPDITPNDIIVVLHRLYPAFMNGCRCITGAFYVDRRAERVAALEAVLSATKDTAARLSSVSHALMRCSSADELEIEAEGEVEELGAEESVSDLEDDSSVTSEGEEIATLGNEDREALVGENGRGTPAESGSGQRRRKPSDAPTVGIMAKGLSEVRRRLEISPEGRSGAHITMIDARVRLIADPDALRRKADGASGLGAGLTLLRDVCVYLLARYILVRAKKV